MNARKWHLTAIWAVSAWPAFNFLGSNWEQVEKRGASGLFGILGVTLVLGSIGHWLEIRADRRGRPGAMCLPWLAVVSLLFAYGPLARFVAITFEDAAQGVAPAVVWTIAVLLVATALVLVRKVQSLVMLATVFSVMVVTVSAGRFLATILKTRREAPAKAAMLAPVAEKPPRLPGLDVYYLLLDAYSGRAGLKAATGFDNREFYDALAARGFVDASTEKSNYLSTIYSLGGIFLLDYPATEQSKPAEFSQKLYPDLFDGAEVPAFIARLNAAGYDTYHSATTWGGCAHRYLICLGQPVILDNDYLTKAFLAPTPFARPIEILSEEEDDSYLSISSRLPLLLARGKPFFIFAHDLAAHPPFVRNAACRRSAKPGETSQTWDVNRRDAYVGAIHCLNRRTLALIDLIVKSDPNALIVLQGDHGSAFGMNWSLPMSQWPLASIRERRSFLNVVRAPADCRRWLDHPMGQINTARFVVACVEGRAPQYLAERGYMSTYFDGGEAGVVRAQPDF